MLRRNYLPQDLQPILEEHRFDGTVLVQANTRLEETRWFLELAGQNAWILGVVGWVDLTGPRLAETLDQLQKHPKFKGVRHPVHDEDDARWMLRDDVLAGLDELARRGLPYDLLFRPLHLQLIPFIVERVPNLRMVIDHIAKPFIADHLTEGWAQDISAAAQFPQIYCKLSGMITEADPQGWKAEDLRPYIQHVLKAFGPERLMFGSDWPVCRLAGSWKQVLAAFTQALGPVPQHTRDLLLGDTATEFYRLNA